MKIAFQQAVLSLIALVGAVVTSDFSSAQSTSSGCESGHCDDRLTRPYRSVQVVTPGYHGYRYSASGAGYRPYGVDHRYGTAELLRAGAQSNLLNAHARTQDAHASRLEMENSVQFLATRLERKRINKETRFGRLKARGELVRQTKIDHALSQPSVSQRPVHPATGQVAWPILLRSSYFARARRPIDQVFLKRSETGKFDPDHFLPMRDWIEKIECELKANVAYYEMEDYLESKDFLRSLIDEARVDVDVSRLPTQLVAR